MQWFWLFQCLMLALAWTTSNWGWKMFFHVLAVPVHAVLLPVYVAVLVIRAVKGLISLAEPKGRQELVDLWSSAQAERIMNPKTEEDRKYAQEFCDQALSHPKLLIEASTK